MMAHTLITASGRQRNVDIYEFKATQVYIEFRVARASKTNK